jgi:hypothetical protein
MIRKNATSSVKWAFLKSMGIMNPRNIHFNPNLVYKGIKGLNGEKVAAIIRNPYERAISNWQNKLHAQADNGRQRKTWLGFGFKLRCSFEEYVDRLQHVYMNDGHMKPQVNHLPLNVDFMLDMDDMPAQWQKLQAHFKWLPDLPKKNFTRYQKPIEEYLTPETKKIIDRIYSKDVSLYEGMKMRNGGLHDVRILKETLSGIRAGQMKIEVEAMIKTFQDAGVKKYLEIGSRYGDTFYDVMRALPEGSKGVCVDLPGDVWGTAGTDQYLKRACDKLRGMGYDVTMILGDSRDPETIKKVAALGPFDAGLLDGDHRYNGIKNDFENYAPMCKIVALHDIVGAGQRHDKNTYVEVPRFWEEIKKGDWVEFIGPGSSMGIGVLWNT